LVFCGIYAKRSYGAENLGRAVMKRLGIAFGWRESPLENILTCARYAEQVGVESIWVPEAWGRDAFLALAAVAEATGRVRLGTGIANVYSRSPAALAMASATLDELSKGRAILGLGSSGPGVVERWHGVRYERPLTRVRETVKIVRLALSGAATNFQGSFFHVSDFKLAMDPPKHTIPIYIAALGSKMLRLAGEVADGVLLYLCSVTAIPNAIEEIRKGATEVGRSVEHFDVAALLPTVISENREQARGLVARAIAYYVGGMGTYYRRAISESGFELEASRISEAWQRGDRLSATNAVSQELIDSVALAGSRDECRRKLEDFRNSGVNLPIISLSTQDARATSDSCKAIEMLSQD
jgi:F420-dependent oxidoreductase-like protein